MGKNVRGGETSDEDGGAGGSAAKAEGQVQVNVSAPPGWRASTANKGSVFREVKLNRGHCVYMRGRRMW
jgi:hypothetical protein